MLGPGNEMAAEEALTAWPQGLQVGGGINEGNAGHWIIKGAEKVSSDPLRTGLNVPMDIFIAPGLKMH